MKNELDERLLKANRRFPVHEWRGMDTGYWGALFTILLTHELDWQEARIENLERRLAALERK